MAAAGGWGIPRMSSLCWQGCSDSKKPELFPNAATPVDAVCVSAGQHWIGVVLGLGNFVIFWSSDQKIRDHWAALAIEQPWWLCFGQCRALLKGEAMDVLLQPGASAEQGQLAPHLLVFTHSEPSCRIKKGWRSSDAALVGTAVL